MIYFELTFLNAFHSFLSELHSVMTSGFATVAGTVMGAYISFGASASHLICASIMSAPAALAMAKLSYPETKKSRTTFKVTDVCVYGFCSKYVFIYLM